MVSSSGDQGEFNAAHSVRERILSQFQGGWATQLNVEQMFTLISGVLPLEACLYYQVLPLFLEGNRLHLGMVTPNDTSALEYVRRIVSYLNYSLMPRAITYDALQVALTSYLNYVGSQPEKVNPREAFSYGHYRHSAHIRNDRVDQTARPTLILDSPEDLDESFEPAPVPESVEPPPYLPASPSPLPVPPKDVPLKSQNPDEIATCLPVDRVPSSQNYELLPSGIPVSNLSQDHELPTPNSPALLESVLPLDVQANYLSSPVTVLATLPPDVMLQELLARVLVGGIGRLYFECHPQAGRVLWSQDGVLQSVLDRLPLPVFQALLNELKQVAQLPLTPITQSQQVEVERRYDCHRVLLRFRFMPGKHGEEATLQVLRGAALRFYQRQQLGKLKRDALGIAKQLQTKLNEIRDRAYAEPGLSSARFESLPALNQLLQNIEEQIDHLGTDETLD
ncbi:MAG: hypothetical protein Kow00121_54870 [Elainellaceae cyanobacterium]